MSCVDRVECIVEFHKVCRMIVSSSDLEVMMGLQLFLMGWSDILSDFVQICSESQTVHSCIHCAESTWTRVNDEFIVFKNRENWWGLMRTDSFVSLGKKQDCFPGARSMSCERGLYWKRMIMKFLQREETSTILNSFDHHVCWRILFCERPLAHPVIETKGTETHHVLFRPCCFYSGISQGLP